MFCVELGTEPDAVRRTMNVLSSIDTADLPVTELDRDVLWYKDAIIYELHVKAFADSNGDGIGDFAGLSEKLDYLQELGVTAIWLLPFYPSPWRDDGYDIADYGGINPAFGTLHDFKAFLSEAHSAGLRVITELVLNHTSDQHPWFQRARAARNGLERAFLRLERHAPRNIRTRESFSTISKRRTGPGIRLRRRSTGIASSRISRI